MPTVLEPIELVIMATLGCSPSAAQAEYQRIEPLLINLALTFPIGQGVITAEKGANLRDGPRINAKVIGAVPFGAEVAIWGRRAGWLGIEKPSGWVSTICVKED